MDKLEEFRKFAATKPHLKELIKDKKMTWQELYERYDIYGPEDEVFQHKEETFQENSKTQDEEEKKEGIGSIIDALSGFDAEKISEGLNGVKKILNILNEVSKPEEVTNLSRRKMSRPYQRNDD